MKYTLRKQLDQLQKAKGAMRSKTVLFIRT